MGKSRIIFGNADGPAPSASTAEDAAAEYFTNRLFMGNWAPRPAVAKWRSDQRERFERELARLEDERLRQCADAVAARL